MAEQSALPSMDRLAVYLRFDGWRSRPAGREGTLWTKRGQSFSVASEPDDATLTKALMFIALDARRSLGDLCWLIQRLPESGPPQPLPPARLFHLQRDVDHSGISGTGAVADGVQWPDRTCTIRWRGEHASTVSWDSIEDVEHIHGHGGTTRIVWEDEPEQDRA